MNRLSKIIEDMDLDDLKKIKKDLDTGNIEKLIKKRMKEVQKSQIATCPVCSARVKEGEGLHLQFGPADFRKKATFDGVDCLQYFLERLKKK
ncbi:MAG: hypothetical protein ACLFNB_02865 [Candidatus Woesearchaeota archaeon]